MSRLLSLIRLSSILLCGKYQEVIAEFEKELPKAIVYSNREKRAFNDESSRIFVDYLDRLIK